MACRAIAGQLQIAPCRMLRTVKHHGDSQAASLVKTQILEDEPHDPVVLDKFWQKVNQEIEEDLPRRRLFAICHLYGKQHLFTVGDYIMVQKHIPAPNGSKIKLEKCMLVGSNNLTLIGRPVLDRDLVHIEATLVEKTMTHTVSNFQHVPRKSGYKRWKFYRFALSVLKINQIKICHKINESQDEVHWADLALTYGHHF